MMANALNATKKYLLCQKKLRLKPLTRQEEDAENNIIEFQMFGP
jgi:hypothetical protein